MKMKGMQMNRDEIKRAVFGEDRSTETTARTVTEIHTSRSDERMVMDFATCMDEQKSIEGLCGFVSDQIAKTDRKVAHSFFDALRNVVAICIEYIPADCEIVRFGFAFCRDGWQVVGFECNPHRVVFGTSFKACSSTGLNLQKWDGEYSAEAVMKAVGKCVENLGGTGHVEHDYIAKHLSSALAREGLVEEDAE